MSAIGTACTGLRSSRLAREFKEGVMGSSQKYWQYARSCAQRARETKQDEDRDTLQQMAKAWINVALVEDDVAREALSEAGSKLRLQ